VAGLEAAMQNPHRLTHSRASLARRGLLASALAGAALLAAPAALAAGEEPLTTLVFRPVADTYVDAARPRATHGTRVNLRASAVRKRTYLRFRVRGLEEIEAATLYVRVASARSVAFAVRRARNRPWRERWMSFRTAPGVVRGSPRAAGIARPGWTAVDVSALVRATGRVTLVLGPRVLRSPLAIRSRESAAPAQLHVRGKPKPPKAPGTTPPPAPPPGTYADRVGFSGSNVWYDATTQLQSMTKLRSGGVTWLREDFHWGAFEPAQGSWSWTVGDRLMRNASLAGLNILGIFAYSSNWGADGPTIYHPPKDPAAYANFCRKVVERYGPGGTFWQENPSLEPRPLTAVEIWNEPWLHQFWRPNPEPARYLELLRAASTAIKAAQPTVKVLASADIFQMRTDTSESRDWFRLLLEADAALFRDSVDALSVHAYSQSRGPLDTTTAQRWRYDRFLLTRDLAAAHGASKPIWITEFGWTTEQGNGDAVGEALQAQYTQQALDLALRQWSSVVEKAFLFYWGASSDAYVGGYSPLRPDGSEKPLWGTLGSLLAAS
jgi:polysaccharide biosynthesis protein PslG